MAKAYNVNQTPATGSVAMYNLLALLFGNGWVVKSSSDGTTYNATGNQLTNGAVGAGGLGNASAWFRIQAPDAARELVVQRSAANNTQWRIKYSPATHFTGGAPAATQVPSATDEVVLLGGGSDAAPTMATLFGADAGYRHNLMVDNASPYGFYSFGFPTGGGNPSHCFIMDPLVAGGFNALDGDPYVFVINGTTGALSVATLTSLSVGPQGSLKNGGVQTMVVVTSLAPFVVAGATAIVQSLGVSSFNGYDPLLPMIYARRSAESAPTGFKGYSSFLRWLGATRATADTLTLLAAGDNIAVRDVALPWNGSAPTV